MTDALTIKRIREIETEIRECVKRTSREIIVIGLRLQEAHDILLGGFENWVEEELGMSIRLARNCMYVAGRFGEQSAIIAGIPPTILYNLASPSTPDKVIDEVITRIQDGEILKVKDVTAMIDATKPPRMARNGTAHKAVAAAAEQVRQELIATGGHVSVDGESIEAAISEAAAESVRPDNDLLARKLDQEDGVEGWAKHKGMCPVDFVDRGGRITLFAPELVTKIRRGMKIKYIIFVNPDQMYLFGSEEPAP